jgi:hypothetical protein
MARVVPGIFGRWLATRLDRSLAVSSGLAASLIGLIQPAPATLYKLKVKSWRFDLRNPDQIVES